LNPSFDLCQAGSDRVLSAPVWGFANGINGTRDPQRIGLAGRLRGGFRSRQGVDLCYLAAPEQDTLVLELRVYLLSELLVVKKNHASVSVTTNLFINLQPPAPFATSVNVNFRRTALRCPSRRSPGFRCPGSQPFSWPCPRP
jgi:hypothetical protein